MRTVHAEGAVRMLSQEPRTDELVEAFVVEGLSLQERFSARERAWVATPNPPAITMAYVAGLANPEFLVEMDAIAVVPL